MTKENDRNIYSTGKLGFFFLTLFVASVIVEGEGACELYWLPPGGVGEQGELMSRRTLATSATFCPVTSVIHQTETRDADVEDVT